LSKNKELITEECLEYLELEKPSIVDSCFTEMKTYCLQVSPGSFRIHNCLSAVAEEDLSPNCKVALTYDQQIIQEKGAMLGSEALESSFWTTWATYLATMKDLMVQKQKSFLSTYFVSDSVPTTYLRGSAFLIWNTPQDESEARNESEIDEFDVSGNEDDIFTFEGDEDDQNELAGMEDQDDYDSNNSNADDDGLDVDFSKLFATIDCDKHKNNNHNNNEKEATVIITKEQQQEEK
jgi:hypothetical protein